MFGSFLRTLWVGLKILKYEKACAWRMYGLKNTACNLEYACTEGFLSESNSRKRKCLSPMKKHHFFLKTDTLHLHCLYALWLSTGKDLQRHLNCPFFIWSAWYRNKSYQAQAETVSTSIGRQTTRRWKAVHFMFQQIWGLDYLKYNCSHVLEAVATKTMQVPP